MAVRAPSSSIENSMPMPSPGSDHTTRASVSTSARAVDSRKRTRSVVPISERAHGANAQAAQADVHGDGRRDGVGDPVGHRNRQADARAEPPLVVFGEEMRRERRQDVLHRGVLVEVAGHTQRGQVADLHGVGDGAAEDDDGRGGGHRGAERTHHPGADSLGQTQVERHKVEPVAHAPDDRGQLGPRPGPQRLVTGFLQRPREAVADERRVVGDDDCLHGHHGRCGHPLLCIGTVYLRRREPGPSLPVSARFSL